MLAVNELVGEGTYLFEEKRIGRSGLKSGLPEQMVGIVRVGRIGERVRRAGSGGWL